jgi:hypothetical protein
MPSKGITLWYGVNKTVYPFKVKSCTGRETWMRRLLGTPPTPPLPPPPPLGCLTVLTPFQGLNASDRGNQWEWGTGYIALRCKVVVSSSSLPESPSSEGDRIGCCCCCCCWWYSSLDPIANTSKISQPSNLHFLPQSLDNETFQYHNNPDLNHIRTSKAHQSPQNPHPCPSSPPSSSLPPRKPPTHNTHAQTDHPTPPRHTTAAIQNPFCFFLKLHRTRAPAPKIQHHPVQNHSKTMPTPLPPPPSFHKHNDHITTTTIISTSSSSTSSTRYLSSPCHRSQKPSHPPQTPFSPPLPRPLPHLNTSPQSTHNPTSKNSTKQQNNNS